MVYANRSGYLLWWWVIMVFIARGVGSRVVPENHIRPARSFLGVVAHAKRARFYPGTFRISATKRKG